MFCRRSNAQYSLSSVAYEIAVEDKQLHVAEPGTLGVENSPKWQNGLIWFVL